jgi:hypothetical protein
MKRLFTTACIATVFAAGLAAQSAGTATSRDQATAGAQGRGGGPRTATGCLRAGTGEAMGTYMLMDVTMLGGRARGDATATGTGPGTSTAAGGGQGRGPQTILLKADAGVDLKPHAGHKIEVTGTIAGGGRGRGEASTTGTATGTASSASGGGQGGGRGGVPRTMTVTEIKMLSTSCS